MHDRRMEILVRQLINGVAPGSIYGLVDSMADDPVQAIICDTPVTRRRTLDSFCRHREPLFPNEPSANEQETLT
jgi:hypothetical protein